MPVFHFPDPAALDAVYEEVERRRSQQRRFLNQVTEQDAARVARLSYNYPTVPPGLITTQVQYGDPSMDDSPAMYNAARRNVQRNNQQVQRVQSQQQGARQTSDPNRPSLMEIFRQQELEESGQQQEQQRQFGQGALFTGQEQPGIGDDVVRGLQAGLRRFGQIAETGAVGATGGTKGYRITRGGIRGMFTFFESAYHELTRAIGSVGAGAIETGAVPILQPGQLQRNIRDKFAEAGPSEAVRALQELRQGNRVNLGSGFFGVSDDPKRDYQQFLNQGLDEQTARSKVEDKYQMPLGQAFDFHGKPLSTIASEQARQATINIYGNDIPYADTGKFIAASLGSEPGRVPFAIQSGLIDLGLQIIADPANLGLSRAGKLRRAAKLIHNKPGSEDIPKIFRHYDALAPGPRNDIVRETSAGFVASEEGRRVKEFMADSTDYEEIESLLKRTQDATVPRKLVLDFLDSETPEDVTPILQRALGTSLANKPVATTTTSTAVRNLSGGRLNPTPITRKLGKAMGGDYGELAGLSATMSRHIEDTKMGRIVQRLPGRQIDVENLDRGVDELDVFMRHAKFNSKQRSHFKERMARLENGDKDGVDRIVEEVLETFKGRLEQQGVSDEIFDILERGDDTTAFMREMGFTQDEVTAIKADIDELDEATPGKISRIVDKHKEDAKGIREAVTNKIKRDFNRWEELRTYLLNDMGEIPYFPGSDYIVMNGQVRAQPSPPLYSQHIARTTPLPDPSEVRRAMSKTRQVLDKASKVPGIPAHSLDPLLVTRIGDALTTQAFKPLVLIGRFPAWASRWIPEEQARMAASGLSSGWKHPFSYLAWMMSTDFAEHSRFQRVGKNLNKFVKEKIPAFGKGRADAKGNPMEEMISYKSAMSGIHKNLAATNGGPNPIPWVRVGKNHDDYSEGIATELAQLASDPVAGRIARDGLTDDVKNAFWDGDLQEIRTTLMKRNRELKEILSTRKGADHYLENSVNATLHQITGGNVRFADPQMDPQVARRAMRAGEEGRLPLADESAQVDPTSPDVVGGGRVIEQGHPELLEAVANGKLGTLDLNSTDITGSMTKWKQAANQELSTYVEDLPPLTRTAMQSRVANQENLWDRIIETGFNWFAKLPSDRFMRSPAYKQIYWQDMQRMYPRMTDEARREVFATASAVNVDEMLKGLKKADDADLTLNEANAIAHGRALSRVEGLFYDYAQRHNVADITRNLWPFAEAMIEVIGQWGRLVRQNPGIVRRAQQIYQEPQGDPIATDKQEGFFHPSPYGDGQEFFTYAIGGLNPGKLISDWMWGNDPNDPTMEMTGAVSGLNLVSSSVLPGIGPVWSVPTAITLPDTSNIDWFRRALFPFGEPEINEPGDVTEQLAPRWMHDVFAALGFGDENAKAIQEKTAIDVLKAKALAGEADLSTPEGFQTALDEAKSQARSLTIIRALGRFFLPTGPNIEFRQPVDTDTGQSALLFGALADAWREMDSNSDTSYEALDKFIKFYGVDPTILTTPKTTEVRPAGETEEAYKWRRDNKEVFRQFPNTAYYARPDSPIEPFHYPSWAAQVQRGDRAPISVDNFAHMRNDILGNIRLEKIRREAEAAGLTGDHLGAYLREYRAYLRDELPGYDAQVVGVPRKASNEDQIREFLKWEGNDKLMETEAGKALTQYLDARDQVLELAKDKELKHQRDDTLSKAKSIKVGHEFLRDTARYLTNKWPEFAPMWSQVFKHELREDVVGPPVAPTPSNLSSSGGLNQSSIRDRTNRQR